MKKNIKVIAVIISVMFVLSTGGIKAAEDAALTDIQNHWAKGTIETLVGMGIINGYPDGTFKPQGTVNADAFIKMAVVSLGHELQNGTDYWASTYIDKAKELGLIEDGEITEYDKPVTRQDMALIVSRTMNEEYPDYLNAYKGLVLDYDSILNKYKEPVLKNICKGIITGYPDGTFKGENNATRAEAATIIVRMIDETKRVKPIFAEPDAEFEAFMASEEASEYVSTEFIHAVKDGVVIFDNNRGSWGTYGQEIPAVYNYPEINKKVYESIKALLPYAKKNGDYIRVYYNQSDGMEGVIWFMYYENQGYGRGAMYDGNFAFSFNTAPELYGGFEKEQQDHPLYWEIGKLVNDDQDAREVNFRTDEFMDPLRDVMETIYGHEFGVKLFDYAIQEHKKELQFDENGYYINYANNSNIYMDNVGISNIDTGGARVKFSTSRPKENDK